MAEISVELPEAVYAPGGFWTRLGQVTPFYGRDEKHVVVGGKWLTPQEARDAAAAILAVAEEVDRRGRGEA
jgi:hypothetical protein